MTNKDYFLEYLSSVIRSNGKPYQHSTIKSYADSITLVTNDLNFHLRSQNEDLYLITEPSELQKLFDGLYSIPEVQHEELVQKYRKTNAFKRYIEFCRTLILDQNQPDLEDYEKSRTKGAGRLWYPRLLKDIQNFALPR